MEKPEPGKQPPSEPSEGGLASTPAPSVAQQEIQTSTTPSSGEPEEEPPPASTSINGQQGTQASATPSTNKGVEEEQTSASITLLRIKKLSIKADWDRGIPPAIATSDQKPTEGQPQPKKDDGKNSKNQLHFIDGAVLVALFGLLIGICLQYIVPLFAAQATSSSMPTPTPIPSTFDLPAAKIQSDLNNLKMQPPDNSVTVVLVTTHETQQYEAQLADILGAQGEKLAPPYKNKDAAVVQISFKDANSDSAMEFARQLSNVNAIFLWPSIVQGSPTAIPTAMATFILPGDKIQSDLNSLSSNDNVAVLLIVDHQVYRYEATVKQILSNDKPAPTPYTNEKGTSVSILLQDVADDTVTNFASQLSDATAIDIEPITTATPNPTLTPTPNSYFPSKGPR